MLRRTSPQLLHSHPSYCTACHLHNPPSLPSPVQTTPTFSNPQAHYVPTIHVDFATRTAILAAWTAASGNMTGEINAGTESLGNPAPFVADFSSRGPTLADNAALLKPDIMGPGEGGCFGLRAHGAAWGRKGPHGAAWDRVGPRGAACAC